MKTKNASPVRQLVLAALFLALAFVLPLLTGQVPKVGNMLCPMHFPVLLCGFVLGGPWGLAVGFIAPLVRSVLFGMPPMFPVAISMAFELAAYGLVSGLLWRRAKHSLPALYAVLLTGTVKLFKRPVTTELLLFTAWAVLELGVLDALFAAHALAAPAAIALGALAVAVLLTSLACYLLYYRLKPRRAYVAGAVPLAAVGLFAAAMAVVAALIR